jgi:hypothetical protein
MKSGTAKFEELDKFDFLSGCEPYIIKDVASHLEPLVNTGDVRKFLALFRTQWHEKRSGSGSGAQSAAQTTLKIGPADEKSLRLSMVECVVGACVGPYDKGRLAIHSDHHANVETEIAKLSVFGYPEDACCKLIYTHTRGTSLWGHFSGCAGCLSDSEQGM